MGRIFSLPPSPWEIQHAAGILAGMTYQAEHDNALPDSQMWRMLERRYELAPVRFTHYHPNISMMIERSNLGAVECPLVAGIPCSPAPRFPFPHHGWTGHMRGGTPAPLTVPPAAVASVPEPPSLALCCVGLALVYFAVGVIYRRRVLTSARDAIDWILERSEAR